MKRPIALGLATALVAVAVGVALAITITPAGCRLGIHGAGQGCQTVAGLVLPTPTIYEPTPERTLLPPAPPSPTPTPTPLPPLPPYGFRATDVPPTWLVMGSGAYPQTATLNCRLPIYVSQSGSGGFLAFPGGTYIADPRSAVVLPPPPAGYRYPGYGGPNNLPSGLTYVQRYDRWLPVDQRWVTPDGSRYAYLYPGAPGVYLVDVAARTTTELAEGHTWTFVGVDTSSVYASIFTPGQPSVGLWRLPFSGTPSQIVGTGYWQAVGGGAAYGTDTSAVPQGVANIIVRMDLTTGATAPWFTVDYGTSTVVGFDSAGHPLIQSSVNSPNWYGSWTNLWLVSGLGQADIIASTSPTPGPNFNWGTFASDQHGFWFGGNTIELVVLGQGAYAMSRYPGSVAGPCQ